MVHFPHFFLLGAGKAGTTALADALDAHPGILLSVPKEPGFFDGPDWKLGVEGYGKRHFPDWDGIRRTGEATTQNLFLPFLPERLHRVNPRARLLAILRHPVERAFSHWWMLRCFGREPESFSRAVELNFESMEEGPGFHGPGGAERWYEARTEDPLLPRLYLEYGHYAEQIERYRAHFPPAQLRIVLLEDFSRHRRRVLREIFEFLGADPEVPEAWTIREPRPGERYASRTVFTLTNLVLHTRVQYLVPRRVRRRLSRWLRSLGKGPPEMDAPTRERLLAHYAAHNHSLAELLKRDLSHWNR
jgi:hypothetical protein